MSRKSDTDALRVYFRLSPAGIFGLPEEDRIVVPEGTTPIESGNWDGDTGLPLWPGTLSRFRENTEIVRLTALVDSVEISIADNVGVATVENVEESVAFSRVSDALQRLLRYATFAAGDHFLKNGGQLKHEIIVRHYGGRSKIGQPFDLHAGPPRSVQYDCEALRHALRRAVRMLVLDDDRLERAVLYYEHARLLITARQELSSSKSPHFAMITASSFLWLWKALAVIIGEPGTDRDYQRRFRDLGFDKHFWKQRVDFYWKLRNSYDVAHYELGGDRVQALPGVYGGMDRLCREVLERYAKRAAGDAET